ncbi:hypothetical protein VNO77_00591 [Canavalia gladiata]|uniref:Uncharacterized protein n=1 Tax=Canavalia gladiata TaxID=3824 RepID=A0AAN9R9G3_CANGL
MSMNVQQPSTTVVEITLLSVEGLSNYTSFFNPSIKPFITLTNLPPNSMSRVEDGDHKFRVPLDPTFSDMRSCLHLHLFTKRKILGPAQLGWCLIPVSDIGLLPPGSVRYLSYRLRGRDGCRGHAIINLSVRLEGHTNLNAPWLSTSLSPELGARHTVIGIPVTAIRGIWDDYCSAAAQQQTRESSENSIQDMTSKEIHHTFKSAAVFAWSKQQQGHTV